MADQKAILKAGDKEIELPILSGTEGQDVIDIRTLGANGYFTFDPGFMATGSCESSITYIDGAKGVLLHRGYPIEELAREASYLEVCYMLLNGEAPDAEQYEDFSATITRHTLVHEQINMFFITASPETREKWQKRFSPGPGRSPNVIAGCSPPLRGRWKIC